MDDMAFSPRNRFFLRQNRFSGIEPCRANEVIPENYIVSGILPYGDFRMIRVGYRVPPPLETLAIYVKLTQHVAKAACVLMRG